MSKFVDPTYETGGNVTVRCKCGALIGVTVRQLDSGHTLVTRRCVRCLDYVPLGNADESNQDEQILAAIIAGGMASGRRVAPAYGQASGGRFGEPGHGNLYGLGRCAVPDGPCCAVGAGVLFAASASDVTNFDALNWFARLHGVHRDFAAGVSDGFENVPGCTTDHCDYDSDDYARGVAVGAAAYDFFCGGDE